MKKDKRLKIVFFLMIIGFFGFAMYRSTVSNIEVAWEDISAEELLRRLPLKDFLLIDVRQPYEYNSGHIPGAISIPLDKLDGAIDNLDIDKDIIVYCASGKRSSLAASKLNSYGFSNILNYSAGINSWKYTLEK